MPKTQQNSGCGVLPQDVTGHHCAWGAIWKRESAAGAAAAGMAGRFASWLAQWALLPEISVAALWGQQPGDPDLWPPGLCTSCFWHDQVPPHLTPQVAAMS